MHQKVAETDEHTIKYEIIYTDKVSLKIHIHPLKIAQNFAFAIAHNGSLTNTKKNDLLKVYLFMCRYLRLFKSLSFLISCYIIEVHCVN